MRKFYLLLLFALPGYYTSFSQNPVVPKITKEYFRSDPFKSDFSSFVAHLVNDPSITDKVIEKRTDSTLFYFEGAYSHHNPFFFKPTKVRVALTELVIATDSLPRDTIYTYQLFAYDTDTKEGIAELKKEFDKIYKRFNKSFSSSQLVENLAGTNIKGATYNFFHALHAVAPFALSWIGPDANKEMCLVLTIRMDILNNRAILPVPFYTLQ